MHIWIKKKKNTFSIKHKTNNERVKNIKHVVSIIDYHLSALKYLIVFITDNRDCITIPIVFYNST